MVKKRVSEPQDDAEPELKESLAQVSAKIEARITSGSELLAKAPHPSQVRDVSVFEKVEHELSIWHSYNVTLMRSLFTGDKIAQEYDWSSPVFFARDQGRGDDYLDALEKAKKHIKSLETIKARLELYRAPDAPPAVVTKSALVRPSSTNVFLVHGHDEAPRETVARFLTQLDLTPIILHEQANAGQALMQKFEHNAGSATFAVVLFTPDDVGASKHDFDAVSDKASAVRPRVRQNVLLELGYFAGLLGLERVAVLHVGTVELPTDFLGVAYIPMDPNAGWKLRLAKELKHAGLSVDMNKA